MTTLAVDLGSLLSLVTREQAVPASTKPIASKTRERPEVGVADDLVSTAQNGGGQDAHMQRVQLNEALARVSRLDQRLSFRVDESSGKSVVIVRDAHTSEVIKQYPSEEMLDVARRLEEYLQQSGDGAGLLHADDA